MGKKTILVVDDAKENINILGELLKEDYNVRAAINGEKALVIAASENKPDLILLDVVMPGMDGHEVCKRLKADITTKDIPIIFITGKSDEKDELKGFEIGAVDYVTKPFSPADFITFSIAILCFSKSLTIPPFSTFSFPTSNCGLISITIFPVSFKNSLK